MEDRKFKFEDGKFVNRVSGEAIPDDEPVFIFRARDKYALAALTYYRRLCMDPHHQQAITESIEAFIRFTETNPDKLREPGTSHHFQLNRDS